jgi:hypothetical protein
MGQTRLQNTGKENSKGWNNVKRCLGFYDGLVTPLSKTHYTSLKEKYGMDYTIMKNFHYITCFFSKISSTIKIFPDPYSYEKEKKERKTEQLCVVFNVMVEKSNELCSIVL